MSKKNPQGNLIVFVETHKSIWSINYRIKVTFFGHFYILLNFC